MKIHKKSFFGLILIVMSFSASMTFGQNKTDQNNICIHFRVPYIVDKNSDLNIVTTRINCSKQPILFYQELSQGIFTGNMGGFTNITFFVERKQGSQYKKFDGSHIDFIPELDSTNPPKKILVQAGDSLVNSLEIDRYYLFKIGYYRIRCRYWNNLDSSRQSSAAGWHYFHVTKEIPRRKS